MYFLHWFTLDVGVFALCSGICLFVDYIPRDRTTPRIRQTHGRSETKDRYAHHNIYCSPLPGCISGKRAPKVKILRKGAGERTHGGCEISDILLFVRRVGASIPMSECKSLEEHILVCLCLCFKIVYGGKVTPFSNTTVSTIDSDRLISCTITVQNGFFKHLTRRLCTNSMFVLSMS